MHENKGECSLAIDVYPIPSRTRVPGSLFLVALASALHCTAVSAGGMTVKGTIAGPSAFADCRAQLVIPGERIAEERVSGTFQVNLDYAENGGPFLVNVTCAGYRVYTSRPLDAAVPSGSFDTGQIESDRRLDRDGCRELYDAEAANALRPMIALVERDGVVALSKVHIGVPRRCSDRTEVFVLGIDEWSGPGMHWMISTTDHDGQTSMERGL